jgi:CheY-like chemotaxis protein
MPSALIVEDEPEANKLLSMLVRLRGYETESAFTGTEALERIECSPPDVVFLDLMLPDINGYEVCKSVKTRPATALIPVVMVTARVAAENRIESYCTGADYYVPKPYTPDQIFWAMDVADAWRKSVESGAFSGEIPFETRDEGEALRRLAQLRSRLIASARLDVPSACRLVDALDRLWARADAWGQSRGVQKVAALGYSVGPVRIDFALRDVSGWFRGDPRSPAERWPEEVARGGFDAVRDAPEKGEVHFSFRPSHPS